MIIENGDRVDFALNILNHPELHQKPKVQEWLLDEGNAKLYEDLRLLLEAGMRLESMSCPDVNREWSLFRQKQRRRLRNRMLKLVSAAASIVLLLGGGMLLWQENAHKEVNPEQPILADVGQVMPGKKQAVLITETGQKVVLDGQKVSQVKLEEGVSVEYDSAAGIRYQLADQVKTTCHTLRIPKAGEYKLVLSDGTMVWLNSESELRYPTQFADGIRQVELKGEAYFEVSKDKTKPFVVLAGGVSTHVYGTEFNIRSYGEEEVNVTLVKGSISVKNESLKQEYMLKPGENACLTGNNFRIEKVNVRKYTAWKEGYFYYENECLDHILKDLKRWYDFDVIYINNKLGDLRFEFWSARHESIETVVRTLTRTNRIDVKMEGKTLIVSEANRLK